MTDETVYELYAIRYAGNPRRHRGHNFILADDPERLEPMDYFSWVAIGPDGAIVIDTGMRQAKALQRGYDYARPPHTVLPLLGVDPASRPDCCADPYALRPYWQFGRVPQRPFPCPSGGDGVCHGSPDGQAMVSSGL